MTSAPTQGACEVGFGFHVDNGTFGDVGRVGAVRMGVEHGGYCVGCCLGLMIVLFALGVMSVLWMVVVAGLIFAQKILPGGERLRTVFAIGLVAAGVWVAFAPGSVPGLTQPGSGMAAPAPK
jgi:predicted metal-binding membrane protein